MTVTESLFMKLVIVQQPEQNLMKIRRTVWSSILCNKQLDLVCSPVVCLVRKECPYRPYRSPWR